MKILYLGGNSGTSRHRIQALGRIGHDVYNLNPEKFAGKDPILRKLDVELGAVLFEPQVRRQTLRELEGKSFDAVWVDHGRTIGPKLVSQLRNRYGPVVLHNLDNPFGSRDRLVWTTLRRAVDSYDLVVVVRRSNVADAEGRGAKKVLFHHRTADEIAHAPSSVRSSTHRGLEVVFVGTAIRGERRDVFAKELLKQKIPLSIYGDRWQQTPGWKDIRDAWAGKGTASDDEYRTLIEQAKVCLCLLSSGNHDLHTTRSVEIPSIGGLLCAPRTADHLELYKDGDEAVLWDNVEECAEVCRRLLESEPERISIARAGRERALRNNLFNEPLARTVLKALTGD